jgi:F-type H+-transporting ATPase subunit b
MYVVQQLGRLGACEDRGMLMRVLGGILLAIAVCGYVAVAHGQELHEAGDPHGGGDEHAAGEHAAHGNTNPLSIDPDLAIFTVLVFSLLLIVLRKFAWKPIIAGLERREGHVGQQLEEAERRNREAEELLNRYQAELAQASAQVRQMLDEARAAADAHREQVLAQTQAAVKSEREQALADIDAAKTRAAEEVAAKSADAAVLLAGRIVRRDLHKDDYAGLIQDPYSSPN